MKEGIVVQIGLEQTAEMLYLTDPDWKQKNREQPEVCVPDEIIEGIESWNYFGIDRDPTSIALMIDKYKSRGTWVCNNLKVGDDLKYASIWTRLHKHIQNAPSTQNRQFLRSVPVEMSDVFRHLYIHRIDVMVVDVDGVETCLFERYDWRIIPRFIHIELHPFGIDPYNRHNIRTLFEGQGYELAEEIRLDSHEKSRGPSWIDEYVYHASFIYRGKK